MKCTLCGMEFDETMAKGSCVRCPFHKGCNLVRCPNCGFETPPVPERLGPAVPLTALKVHQKGKVAYLRTGDRDKLQKFMILGILPGMTITLIQKFPSCVFQIAQSQFAIDIELASRIYVRRI